MAKDRSKPKNLEIDASAKHGGWRISSLKGKIVEIHTHRWRTRRSRAKCVGIDDGVIFISRPLYGGKVDVESIDLRNVVKMTLRNKSDTVKSFEDLIGKEITVHYDDKLHRKLFGMVVDVTYRTLILKELRRRVLRPTGVLSVIDLSSVELLKVLSMRNSKVKAAIESFGAELIAKTERKRSKLSRSAKSINEDFYSDLEEWDNI